MTLPPLLFLGLLAVVGCAALPLSAQKSPVEGLAGSPVRVLIFEDLQCSDCAVLRIMMDEKLLPRYGSQVAFVHKEFPLPRHTWARRAAVAARYLGERKPELGVAFRRFILSDIKQTTDANFSQRLDEFAEAKGVDSAALQNALSGKSYAEWVEKDYQEGVARGVSKTPTVFVDGKPFIETFTFEELAKAIDEALAQTR